MRADSRRGNIASQHLVHRRLPVFQNAFEEFIHQMGMRPVMAARRAADKGILGIERIIIAAYRMLLDFPGSIS